MALSQADLAAAYSKGLAFGAYGKTSLNSANAIVSLHSNYADAVKATQTNVVALILPDGSTLGRNHDAGTWDYPKYDQRF